jgi:hypothetical protein
MTAADRQRLVSLARYLIEHRNQLGYPVNDVRGPLDQATWKITTALGMQRAITAGKTLTFDCSQAVTQLYRWAKLSDPNGLDYTHSGYTGTMLAHLRHYSDASAARDGALVVFGPGTGEHVSMVIERGPDPVLFSHGATHASGPIRLSVERTFHRPPVTLLNVSGL